MPQVIPLESPRPRATVQPPGFALWNLGFRPFYMLASIFAALSVPLWIAHYEGYLPGVYAGNPVVHGHEMLFGFALAVVTGFLFTAVRNWTGKDTPTGALLAAYAALWLAGRALAFTPYGTVAAVANAVFVFAVAAGIAVPMVTSGNRRNYFFVGLLVLLGVASLAVHLSAAGAATLPGRVSLRVGLDVVLFIMAVMGGRVIPMFTNNGVPGAGAERHPLVEKAALGGVIVLLAVDLLPLPPWAVALVAACAAITHAARLALWRPWRTGSAPLVWILHAAYGWIVVYLLLRAAAAFGLVADPLATHALTIGAIGSMTIGMMMRTARGHTGLPLVVDRFEIACFVLIQAAAVSRVIGGMLLAGAYVGTVVASGLCWSVAFAIYAVRYWPILSRTRADGKPG